MTQYKVLVGCHAENGKTYCAGKNDIVESSRPLDEMFVNKFAKMSAGNIPVTSEQTKEPEPAKEETATKEAETVTGDFDSALNNPGMVVTLVNKNHVVHHEDEKISKGRLAKGKVNEFIDAWVNANLEPADDDDLSDLDDISDE